jgi:FtsP/CotA-like multicopper oxidase with cupredoxin domain
VHRTPDRARIFDGALSRRGLLRTAGGAIAVGATPLLSGGSTVSDTQASDQQGHRIKEYWIQAESFWHNLVPNGKDNMTGATFTAAQTSLWALGFRAYTPHWGAPLPGNDDIGPNTGIPGPIIRGEVGETLRVHFRNNDQHYGFPHSMHPHGVRYDPFSDGAFMADNPTQPGTNIKPGETYTYTWQCLPSSVGTWPYHDHAASQDLHPGGSSPVMEIGAELGLFGMIAVTDHRTPPVDKEFFVFFHDLYAADVPTIGQDTDCFNGNAFVDNTPTFHAKVGDRVRFRVATLGKEFHVFHTHGHRWWNGMRFTDSQVIGPSETVTAEWVEDNPGSWLYHCHVTDHMMGGMVGRYVVSN